MGVNPSAFSASGKWKDRVVGRDTELLPVEQVSWHDAVEFCRRLSENPEEKAAGRFYHLPSEAQWDACRAGSSGRFHFNSSYKQGLKESEERELLNHEWCELNSDQYPHAPGEKPANAWGLYNMPGNVMEWCQDYCEPRYYARSPTADPINLQKKAAMGRVARGGSWGGPPRLCRPAYRAHISPEQRFHYLGFRVVMVLSGKLR